ncbi:putative pectinesterase [Dioscorea sansibarensis]
MKSCIITLVLAALLVCISAGRHTPAEHPATDFIKSSCRSTTYPELCVECLSAYAPALHRNPRQLAHAALSVSVDRARSASTFVARVSASHGAGPTRSRESGAIRDCFETMSDSVDQLRKSIKEMGKMAKSNDKRGFAWHLSNVETWVSAALTDQSTCMDGLAEDGRRSSRVRASIRKKVLDVAHVTSNALALINKIKPAGS